MLSMPIHVVITCHIADLLSSLALDDNFELQCTASDILPVCAQEIQHFCFGESNCLIAPLTRWNKVTTQCKMLMCVDLKLFAKIRFILITDNQHFENESINKIQRFSNCKTNILIDNITEIEFNSLPTSIHF